MDTTNYAQGGSSYLKAADTQPFTTTINDVIESVDYNKNQCLVLDTEQGKITLKWYHVKELQDIFGTDSDKWIGKNVHINKGVISHNGTDYDKFIFEQVKTPQEEVPPTPQTNDLPF